MTTIENPLMLTETNELPASGVLLHKKRGAIRQVRRVLFPDQFRSCPVSSLNQFSFDPTFNIPEFFTGRGRWKSGAMHTFVDDYRQEFFWRRPEEGLLCALAAGIVTAPDFTVFNNDPAVYRHYQAWRSAQVSFFWQSHGVSVIPVVSFDSGIESYVEPYSLWAIRSPSLDSNQEKFFKCLKRFISSACVAKLVIFGRENPAFANLHIPITYRALNHGRTF